MAFVTLDELHDYQPGCRIVVPTVFATGPISGQFRGVLPANDYASKSRERHPAIIVGNGDMVTYVRTVDMPRDALIKLDKRSARKHAAA